MKFFITGDTHGSYNRFYSIENYISKNFDKNDSAVIILGDAGFNFYLNSRDKALKTKVNNMGIKFYCVRGNHEARPSSLSTIKTKIDENVLAQVQYEEEFPNILYLQESTTYLIEGHPCIVIGGAYSVDKYYRLEHKWPWFKDELLDHTEMDEISAYVYQQKFDFVFSHTCPLSWEPTDLFLDFIDQSTVNTSMENWMEALKDTFDWKVWLFGHFHDDRLVRPGVEMFFTDIQPLSEVWERWQEPVEILPYWNIDPKYNEVENAKN